MKDRNEAEETVDDDDDEYGNEEEDEEELTISDGGERDGVVRYGRRKLRENKKREEIQETRTLKTNRKKKTTLTLNQQNEKLTLTLTLTLTLIQPPENKRKYVYLFFHRPDFEGPQVNIIITIKKTNLFLTKVFEYLKSN